MSAGQNADFNSADITAESILSEFHIMHKAPHANGIVTGFNSDMIKCQPQLTLGECKPSYFDGSCDASEGVVPPCA